MKSILALEGKLLEFQFDYSNIFFSIGKYDIDIDKLLQGFSST